MGKLKSGICVFFPGNYGYINVILYDYTFIQLYVV